jgi:hypothetical protein
MRDGLVTFHARLCCQSHHIRHNSCLLAKRRWSLPDVVHTGGEGENEGEDADVENGALSECALVSAQAAVFPGSRRKY